MTLWIVKDPDGNWTGIIRSDRVPRKYDGGSYRFYEYGDNAETLRRIPLPEVEPGACYRVTLERSDDVTHDEGRADDVTALRDKVEMLNRRILDIGANSCAIESRVETMAEQITTNRVDIESLSSALATKGDNLESAILHHRARLRGLDQAHLELERRVSDLESRVMHLQSPTYVLRPMPFGDVPPPSCTCEASRKGE